MKLHRLVYLLLVPGLLFAQQEADLRLPISLDADSTDWDGKTSMLLFRGLRLSQGQISVVADEGRASKLDFEDSVWRFNGNVIIDVEGGHIECESADLQFTDHTLRIAIIEGSPATFELQRPESEEITYAEAGRLEYDLASQVVEFSDNATITEAGNQISSSYLVYNIVEQRIKAQSSGNGDEKVKITYTPNSAPSTERDPETDAGEVDAEAGQAEIDATDADTGDGDS